VCVCMEGRQGLLVAVVCMGAHAEGDDVMGSTFYARLDCEQVTAASGPSTRQNVHAAGWGGLGAVDAGDIPSGVLIVGEVPHDWLFPRCTAVVHHGGAGALPRVRVLCACLGC